MTKSKRKNPLNTEQQNLVECIFDEHGPEAVLVGMADICYERAATKGDMYKGMQQAWKQTGFLLDKCALEIPI